ncbi:hypothetical protein [Streptosporangium sp. CA-115845]|uniref:hypothetical protein n=1 Tax=Streptosporangium sp. CA-115845 TaxID=3240071 RepID=UPI003D94EE9A
MTTPEGHAGGIALTHIKPVPGGHEADECRAVSKHGDVCVRPKEHTGLCRSGVGRKHVSSPEKAGRPWHWYRAAEKTAPADVAQAADFEEHDDGACTRCGDAEGDIWPVRGRPGYFCRACAIQLTDRDPEGGPAPTSDLKEF